MFNVKSITEVKEIIKDTLKGIELSTIKVKVEEAKGYITSKDIVSTEDVPHFNRSTVDGYAVIKETVMPASISSPIMLKRIGESIMGKECKLELDNESTVYVPTGGHVPNNTTGVVMIEQTEILNDEVLIYKGVSHFENMLLVGSDVQLGEVVINKNTRITDTTIGLLKSLGINEVEVYQKLKVKIISTGDEITNKKDISIGEIRDINTYTISSFLNNYPVTITKTEIIQDDFRLYKKSIIDGLDNDIIISSGGSSVGEKDYTVKILDDIKADVLVHGINIKPGKPTILAKKDNSFFIGLPGQPTSAYIVLNELFNDVFESIYSIQDKKIKPYIEGTLTMNVHASQGRKLYQIVSIKQANNQILVTPLFTKSGMIKLLSKAYGYIVLDDNQEGLDNGTLVKVYRFGD